MGQQGLGRFTTTGRHHLGDVRQKSRFVAFRARFQIPRHQIGGIGLDHQPTGRNAGHLFAQQLTAAFVAEPASHPDMQPQRQTLVQLLVGAGEAVQHGTRQLRQPGTEDLDKTGVGIAAVEKLSATVGTNKKLSELGASSDNINDLTQDALRDLIILNTPKYPTRADVHELYARAL